MKLNYNVTKEKDYTVDLNDIKPHLNLTSDDNEYDQDIENIIYPAAVDEAEAYLKRDIVPTINTYEITDFTGYMLTLPSANYKDGINVTVDGSEQTIDEDYTITAGQTMNTVIIEFTDNLQGSDITVVFNSGYETIPPRVFQAIRVGCANMFDPERSGYISTGYKKTDVWERLLNTARNIFGSA